jgi:hypothetical protein
MYHSFMLCVTCLDISPHFISIIVACKYNIFRAIRRTMILDGKFRGKMYLHLKPKQKMAVQYEVSAGHTIP